MFHATTNKSNVLSQNSCSYNIHHIQFNLLMAPYLFKLCTVCTLGLNQWEVIYNIWGQGCRVTSLGSWCDSGNRTDIQRQRVALECHVGPPHTHLHRSKRGMSFSETLPHIWSSVTTCLIAPPRPLWTFLSWKVNNNSHTSEMYSANAALSVFIQKPLKLQIQYACLWGEEHWKVIYSDSNIEWSPILPNLH